MTEEEQVINKLIISNLKGPIKELQQLEKQKLVLEKENIDYIINKKIKNKLKIEKSLDNLLDLTYWYGVEMNETFYKLLNYLKTIDINLSKDYEKYYLEIIEEE